MTKIKICGITTIEDLHLAISHGADAVGFIFVENTPRYVTINTVKEMVKECPPFINKVGVFLNHDQSFINDAITQCNLDVLQLHGQEEPNFCNEQTQTTVKTISVKKDEDLQNIQKYKGNVSGILLDTKVEGMDGGTGQTFDWNIAIKAKDKNIPIILAGGITADNVANAIMQVQPYAIDVCSGVESEPGKKDPFKLTEFFKNARNYGN